jgi:hypothetical protein
MKTPSRNERDLYADLTLTLMAMKSAPFEHVQAALEERFRRFLLHEGEQGSCALQITWTCSLPEGPASFAIYRTEYQTMLAQRIETPAVSSAVAGGSAEIIPFPFR